MRVRVGKEYLDGTFEGEEIEFEGREVDVWEGPIQSQVDPDETFIITVRLYEGRDGYRVHEIIWADPENHDDAFRGYNDLSLYPPVAYLGYGTYTAEEAREQWGEYFGVL